MSARSEAVSIWLSWLHRPVIRYIFAAEPRQQRMPLLPGLAGIILDILERRVKVVETKFVFLIFKT